MHDKDVREIVLKKLIDCEYGRLVTQRHGETAGNKKAAEHHYNARNRLAAQVDILERLCVDLGYAPGIWAEVDEEVRKRMISVR